MALDAETKKLFAGDQWAIDGDRLDVESSDGAPVIDRSIGFQGEFSTTKTINREKLNQIICELSGAAKVVREGVPAYDATISYPPGSVVKVNGEMYYQGSDTNSTGVQPTSAGNMVWALVAGVSQAERIVPPALSANAIIIDGTRADRFNVRLVIDNSGGYPIDQVQLRYSKDSTMATGLTTDTNYTQGEDKLISGNDADLYYVQVRLHNSLGWGGCSSIKDVGSPLSPDGPSWVTASPANRSVGVSWGATIDNGLSITSHTIEYKESTQAWSAATSVSVTNSNGYAPGTHSITGLTNGTAYDFRVRSVSNRGTTGSWRTASATPAPYPNAPDAPSVGAVALSQTEVLVYISGDTTNNGAAITGYKFQKRTSGGTWETETSLQSAPYYIFTGLTADTTYDVRARASNSAGTGSQGSSASVSALAVGTPSTPGVIATRASLASFVYYAKGDLFDEGGSSITKYRRQLREVGSNDWSTAVETTNAGGVVSISDPKKAYELQLGAHNGTNWSAWSASVNLPAFSSSGPSNLKAYVSSGGVGKAVVSVAGDLYTADSIIGYIWEYKLSTASDWTALAESTTSTQVITGLTGGATYNFRVKAEDYFGTTTSSTVNFTLPAALSWSGITPYSPRLLYSNTLLGVAVRIWGPDFTHSALNQRLAGYTNTQYRIRAKNTSTWYSPSTFHNNLGNDTYEATDYTIRNTDDSRNGHRNTAGNLVFEAGATLEMQYRIQTSIGWSDWSQSLTMFTLI